MLQVQSYRVWVLEFDCPPGLLSGRETLESLSGLAIKSGDQLRISLENYDERVYNNVPTQDHVKTLVRQEIFIELNLWIFLLGDFFLAKADLSTEIGRYIFTCQINEKGGKV